MSEITLTLPLDDHAALYRASEMLRNLSEDCVNPIDNTFQEYKGFMLKLVADNFDMPVKLLEDFCNYKEIPTIVADDLESQDNTAAKAFETAKALAAAKAFGKTDEETSSSTAEPAKPASPLGVAPVGVEVDSAGLPWDARIHGAAKKKTKKDELWKKIRGVDPALVETVEAELHAAMAIPAASSEASGVTAEVTKVTKKPAPPAETVVTEITPGVAITFPELMAKITNGYAGGTLTEAQVTKAVADQGLGSLPLLAARPDFVPAVNIALFGA